MKQFKVLNVLVLILVLCLSGCNQEQDTAETVDDLLSKFIEFFDKKDADNAIDCLHKAIELDPTKRVYFKIIGYMVDGKFAEVLKLLEERKDKSPVEKERKVIQILEGETHYLWAEELKKKYDYINAITHYEAAYGIDIIYRRKQSAVDLINIGFLYAVLGQKQKALEYYEKALPISHEVGDRSGEATTLINIGMVYSALGQKQKTLEYLEKVLSILEEIGDKASEAVLLSNLMVTWNEMNKNSLAIFYGKQAVNMLQNLRHNIDNLDIKTKLKYMQSKENTYRITASQLIFSGRLCEAQQVLDILKDEEYFSFVLQNRSAYIPQYAPIDYTGFESKWINRQNTIVKKISSISSPYNELLIKPNKTPKEEKKLESLKVELEKAQKEYRDFLDQLKKEFETYKYKEDPDIDAITTPTSQTVKQSPPFDDKEFNAMIYAYRDLIEKLARLSRIANPPATAASKIAELSRQKRDIENKLYNLIFKPVHQYLKQYGAFNLLVSLDGVLRYIPLTSLWDGEHYLVQQYRFVLLTPSILKQMDEKPVIENKILGMGASKGGKGFKPLPHAGQEIRAIVNDREKGCTGLIKGNALIDNDFTRRNHDQQA